MKIVVSIEVLISVTLSLLLADCQAFVGVSLFWTTTTTTRQTSPTGGVAPNQFTRVSVHLNGAEESMTTSFSVTNKNLKNNNNATHATIRNFRQARGLPLVYRCAKTDPLAQRLGAAQNADEDATATTTTIDSKEDYSPAERFFLYDVQLILDLRSDSERDEAAAQQWMAKAPGGRFVVATDRLPPSPGNLDRCVLRLDPLSPDAFMSYLEQEWLSPSERAELVWYKLVDGSKAHALRMHVLNQRGLFGLNQAILETGKEAIFEALAAMTTYREQGNHPRAPLAVHCVQGKDRTGLVVMLCQSILGIPDQDIIEDYNLSEATFGQSAAMNMAVQSSSKQQQQGRVGKLDKKVFRGAPKEVMRDTLAWLRERYGSISGYLDDIGFDRTWRTRAQQALDLQTTPPLMTSSPRSKL